MLLTVHPKSYSRNANLIAIQFFSSLCTPALPAASIVASAGDAQCISMYDRAGQWLAWHK